MKFKYLLAFALCFSAPVMAQTNAAQTATKSDKAAYKFEVTDVTGGFRNSEPLIIEKPGVMQYDSPWFTANATVKCTMPPGENWTVGFIQQVDAKDQRNEYANALTSMEIPKSAGFR